MNLGAKVTQKQLMNVLLNVAVTRPVFIWGAPGIGKSKVTGCRLSQKVTRFILNNEAHTVLY